MTVEYELSVWLQYCSTCMADLYGLLGVQNVQFDQDNT